MKSTTKFIATFRPKEFWPCPEGTILRYITHEFNKDTQEYHVYMEVLGKPVDDYEEIKPHIIRV